jgi:hypothetical protein
MLVTISSLWGEFTRTVLEAGLRLFVIWLWRYNLVWLSRGPRSRRWEGRSNSKIIRLNTSTSISTRWQQGVEENNKELKATMTSGGHNELRSNNGLRKS